MSHDRSVLRLIPEDKMLAPIHKSEISCFVWCLVSISNKINTWWGVKRKWTEYVHISGVGFDGKGKWYPIHVEDKIVQLKNALAKRKTGTKTLVPKKQRLTVIDDDDDPTNDVILLYEVRNFITYFGRYYLSF